MYDWANSAYVTTVAVAVLPAYFAAVVVPQEGVSLFGVDFAAASLWGYLVSAASALIFFLAPVLGAVADYSGSKRRFLMFFCYLGCTAAALLWFSTAGMVWQTMLLFGIAQVSFIASIVFYDAFLPHIAAPQELDRVSGRGFAYGYLGGGLQFALSLGIIAMHEQLGLDKGQAARLVMCFAAVWWGGFALVTFRGLREPTSGAEGAASISGYARIGFSRIGNTFSRVRNLPLLTTFLIAYFFYNDGIQTTIFMATIYGKTELGLSETTLMLTLLMIQFLAVGGAFFFSRLAERFGAKKALVFALSVFFLAVIYAGFITSATQYFILGAAVGLVLGGSQALSRSLYAGLVPKENSAEFFGYYSVVARLSAIGGPFLFAFVSQATGSSRQAIFVIALFFLVGISLLLRIRVR